jgi:hypothetical protein
MKNFINRPIPRLLRYELLLKGIMDESPPGHDDLETIPNVIDVIKALGKETEPGVFSAKQKVGVWKYNADLSFKTGEYIVKISDPRFVLDVADFYVGHGFTGSKPVVGSSREVASST